MKRNLLGSRALMTAARDERAGRVLRPLGQRSARSVILGLSALVAGSASLPSCSLMGLSNFELGECTSDAECRLAFNEKNGLYPECGRFQCKKVAGRRTCVDSKTEVCDGQDNDCDYVIDEPPEAGAAAILSATTSSYAEDIEDVGTLSSLRSSEAGDLFYLSDGAGSSSLLATPQGKSQPQALALENWTQAEPIDGVAYQPDELTTLASGCYRPDGSLQTCAVSDVAVAGSDDIGFFAQIDTESCNSGELRVGVIQTASPERLIDRGRGARDPTYRGVSTLGSICSSNGRTECLDAKTVKGEEPLDPVAIQKACGVSAPAVAAVSDQALVAYLGQASGDARCRENTPVLGLGLFLGQGELEEDFFWADPSNDGEPERLGESSGGAAPAVLAIGDAGFVVGLGSSTGQVELTWVPRQPAPSPNDGLTCGGTDPLCDDRTDFETAGLRGVRKLGNLGDTGRPDGVHLAALPLADDASVLAVTWVDGCVRDAGASLLGFAQILLLQVDGGGGKLTQLGPALALGEVARPPLPVASGKAFVNVGFSRGGLIVTTPELGGGFYIVVDGEDPEVFRLLALDGGRLTVGLSVDELMGDAPVADHEEEPIALPEEARAPLLSDGDDTFIAHDRAKSRLVRATLGCE